MKLVRLLQIQIITVLFIGGIANATTTIGSGSVIDFNTTDAKYKINGGAYADGSLDDVNNIALFTFDGLDIQSGATVNVFGVNSLKISSTAGIIIDANISVSGNNGSGANGGVAKIGGWGGGKGLTTADGTQLGYGPGAGDNPSYGGGGGGGHGGNGGDGGLTYGGETYDEIAVTFLRGGSGGAGGVGSGGGSGGGAGGGAIELEATGNITIGGQILAKGGNAGHAAYRGGGGGSGGTIIIDAYSAITISSGALLSAAGGNGDSPTYVGQGGGGGGGGRVCFYGSSLTIAGSSKSTGVITASNEVTTAGGAKGFVSSDHSRDGEDGQNGTIYYATSQPAVPAGSSIYYVSPNGSDANSGTISSPFKTLEKARNTIHNLKTLPSGGVTVYLRGGKYFLTERLDLTAQDSGTSDKPIKWVAYQTETPRIIVAEELSPQWFTTVTSGSPIWNRLNSSARGYVKECNLPAHDIDDFGHIEYSAMLNNAGTTGVITNPSMEFCINQQKMQLARYPDSSFSRTSTAIDSTTFVYTGTRPSSWTNATDPWALGYWNDNGYYETIVGISSINTSLSRITLADNPCGRGVSSNRPYFVMNLLEEITVPGEWYVERDSGSSVYGKLFVWPTADFNTAEILVSKPSFDRDISNTPMVRICYAGYITLKGITFEMGPVQAVAATASDNINIDQCVFKNGANGAASLTGCDNGTIKSCDFSGFGLGGIAMGDETGAADCNILLTNNYFVGLSRWNRGYQPGIWMNSQVSGVTISHNTFEDMPSMALRNGGPNHIIQYNSFINCCFEADDMAPLYGSGSTGGDDNIIRYNEVLTADCPEFYGIYGHGLHGLYYDVARSNGTFYGNIIYDVHNRVMFNNGGSYNVYYNNMFIDCASASSLHYASTLSGTPTGCSVSNSIATTSSGLWTDGAGMSGYTIGTATLQKFDPLNLGFLDFDSGIWALRDNSPAYNCGFTRIPWEKIGPIEVNVPSNPIPLDDTANQYRPVTLHWAPAVDANHSKVYFSTNYNSVSAHDANSYQGTVYDQSFLADNLAQNTAYYWSVKEYDDANNLIGTGPVWSFTTGTERIFGADEAAAYSTTNSLSDVGVGGSGWASAWERASGAYCAVDVVSGSLNPNFTDYSYATSGNSLMSDSDWTPSDAMRKLAVPINLKTNNTYYLSYLVKGTDSSNVNCTMDFYDAKAGNLGFGVGMFYSGTQFGIKNFSGSYQYFGSWSSNTTYLVIAKIQASVTGNDTVSVKVYSSGTGAPPSTEPATWDSTVTGTSDVVCSWIKLDGRTSATYQWYLDEIHLKNSWADLVSPVTYTGSTETFSYSTTDTLSSVGTGGIGWASNWEGQSSTTCDVDVVSASLSPGFNYITTGNKIYFDADGTQNEACRQLSIPINFNSNQTYYVSYLVRATDSNNVYYYMQLRDGTKGGTTGVGLGMYYKGYAGLSSAKFAIRDFNNVPQYFGSWSSNTTYLVIAKIQASTSGNDTVSMSVYSTTAPPHTEPAAWDKTVAGTSSATFEWIRSTARASSTYGVYCDEIHIEQSWAEITAPVTYAGSTETFNYSTTSTLSSVGTGGIGWASNWEGATSATCDVDVVSASLSPGFNYITTGNKIYFDADGTQNEACRQLSIPINFNSDQTYYVSYLVRATDSNNVLYVTQLRDGTKGGTAGVGLGMYYKGYAGLGSAQFAIRDFNNVPQYFGSWSSNTTYLVIAKIQASTSGNDTVSMNVYSTTAPPQTEPATWDKTVTGTNSATFEWIRSTARASSTFGAYCDEIRVEDQWTKLF